MFQRLPKGAQAEVPMKTINVDNLPEPVVRAMEAVVQTLREQYHTEEEDSVDPVAVKAAILARRDASRGLNWDWKVTEIGVRNRYADENVPDTVFSPFSTAAGARSAVRRIA